MRPDRTARSAKISSFFGCVALATCLLSDVGTAQTTVSVQNNKAIGINYNFGTATESLDIDGGGDGRTNIRNNIPTNATGKAWIQFDLSAIWAANGQANLTGVNLALWNANGTTRQFDVAGLAESAALEGWETATTNWANAPANIAEADPANVTNLTNDPARYGFEAAKIFGGVNLWERRSTDPAGHDVQSPTFTQNTRYDSQDDTTDNPNILSFLKADTDGKLTFLISGSPNNLNQSMYIAAAGKWTEADLPTLSSPTLTLTFGGATPLTGDFNADGQVNSVDLNDPTLGWRARYGVNLDGNDFVEWQRSVNDPGGAPAVGASAHAVPEPSSSVILLGTIFSTFVARWRCASAA